MKAHPAQFSSRRAVAVLMLLVMVVASSAAVSQVWTRLRAIDLGYKISKASSERARLLQVNRRFKLEVALLKDPARIARIATEELGLQQPRADQVRRLRGPFDREKQEGARVARALR